MRDVIIRSDDMWVLMVLESDAKCGEDCRNMRREVSKLESKSHGLFKFAYTNAHDNLVVQDGSLRVAGAYFNITGAKTQRPVGGTERKHAPWARARRARARVSQCAAGPGLYLPHILTSPPPSLSSPLQRSPR